MRVVKGGSVVRKVGLEDVEVAVAVVVADGGTHAGLLAAILVEGDTGVGGAVGEGAIVIVAVEDGGCGVAGHIDVGPAVFIGVNGGDGKAVVASGLGEAAFDGDVFEFAVTEIAIKDVGRPFEAARPAHDGHALPHTTGGLAWLGHVLNVEVDVVGDGDVEFAIAVVVDEGATCPPLLAGAGDAGLLRNLAEAAVAFVVIEAILAVAGYVEIGQAIVIVVANAGPLAPAGAGEPGLRGDVGEGAVLIVVEEVARRRRSGFFGFGMEVSSIDEEDVGVAVAVVIKDGDAGTGSLEDVALGGDSAVNVEYLDASLRSDVFEPCGGYTCSTRRVRFRYPLRGSGEGE